MSSETRDPWTKMLASCLPEFVSAIAELSSGRRLPPSEIELTINVPAGISLEVARGHMHVILSAVSLGARECGMPIRVEVFTTCERAPMKWGPGVPIGGFVSVSLQSKRSDAASAIDEAACGLSSSNGVETESAARAEDATYESEQFDHKRVVLDRRRAGRRG